MYPLALRRLHPYFTFTGAFTGALTASAPRDVESARHTAGSMLLAMNPHNAPATVVVRRDGAETTLTFTMEPVGGD